MISQGLSLIHGTKAYTCDNKYLKQSHCIYNRLPTIIVDDNAYCKLSKDDYIKIH